MAGRGRGAAVSFNVEQLGIGRGEAPISVTQPPPLFPILENRPLPLIKDLENEYILVTHKDLHTRMRSSLFYLEKANQNGVQQYPDEINRKSGKELPVLWNRMPMELIKKRVTKTKSTTGKSKTNLSAKKRKVEDPDKILAKLEQKETNESDGEGAGDGKDEEDNQDKSDDEKVEIEDGVEEEIDEEMDEGTDYANNYFDNGEGYGDDDDNDDGEPQF